MQRSFGQEVGLIIIRAGTAFFIVLGAFVGLGAWLSIQSAPTALWGSCDVAILPVMGEIGIEYDPERPAVVSDDIISLLSEADDDERIRAIILRIDSPGGYVVASEYLMRAVRRTEKPVVALIREAGTSGAYLAASAADRVIASENSSVGGIGVTSSYVDVVGQNEKEGKSFIELVSAKYKEAGNPNRTLTEDERSAVEADLAVVHRNLVAYIAENRDLPVAEVEALADGSTMLGKAALTKGLIDEIGDEEAALEWLRGELGQGIEPCEPAY